MEIKRKKTTLAGLFGRYIVVFAAGTVLAALIAGAVMFFMILVPSGPFLPANYAEQQLINTEEKLREADLTEEEMIPSGSLYGVFDREGGFLYGSFDEEVQQDAWKKYKTDNIYPQGKGYYFFVEKDNGEICIVKYFVAMRYANEKLNEILPSPETFNLILTLGLFLILIVLNGFFLSRRFGRKLNKQLACLTEATARISENDLEFISGTSEIREVDEVMVSLEKMKEALKASLKNQWDTEQLKNQQLAALTHDIKTPLTVVRGNAELLTEAILEEDDRECAEEILKNTEFIETYLDSMRQVLKGRKEHKDCEEVAAEELVQELLDFARQLAAARKILVSLEECFIESRRILCCREEILRAWGNLVDNALEHTDPEKGICVTVERKKHVAGEGFAGKQTEYLRASVRDFGPGFSEKALLHGTEAFFSGDESRHDRTHQGLGLSIAEKFIQKQGGFLEYRNVDEGSGALVALWIKE